MPKKYSSKKAATKYRGGFVPRSFGKASLDLVKPYATAALKAAAKDAKDFSLDYASKKIKDLKVPNSVEVGARVLGKLAGAGQDAISGSHNDSAFIQTNGVKRRVAGSADYSMQRYYTNFESGRPNPRAMKQLARLNGTTRVELLNTRYNPDWKQGTTNRDFTKMESGFNCKTITAMYPIQWSALDMHSEYDLSLYSSPANKLQRNYGQVMNLFRTVRVMNVGKFFSSKVTFKLYKCTTESTTIGTNIVNGFHTAAELASGNQIINKFPIKYQFEAPNTNTPGLTNIQIDPKASILDSPNMSRDYDFVRSFSKTLRPGEVWDFTEKFFCGAGINLSEIQALHATDSTASLGYQLIMEQHGVPCEAAYGGNSNESFIGLSPSYLQVEMIKGHESVNASLQNVTNYLTGNTGGLTSSRFHVRSFTDRTETGILTTEKLIHFFPSDIEDAPTTAGGKIYIPVMSDTTTGYADRRRD